METKSFAVKAPSDGGHSFVGYASTWTENPDSYGDVVVKGAFADSLKTLGESGRSLPVLWSHEFDNPASYVAKVVEAVEDDHGLKIVGEFFDDPDALKVWRLLKEGLVNEMSFAFDIVHSDVTEVDGKEVRRLKKLNLYEVSVVMFGANSDTSIESVKAADRLTADEIATLKRVATEFAPTVGEVAGKAGETSEDAKPQEGEGEVSQVVEDQQRVKRAKTRFAALCGEEGDSK